MAQIPEEEDDSEDEGSGCVLWEGGARSSATARPTQILSTSRGSKQGQAGLKLSGLHKFVSVWLRAHGRRDRTLSTAQCKNVPYRWHMQSSARELFVGLIAMTSRYIILRLVLTFCIGCPVLDFFFARNVTTTQKH